MQTILRGDTAQALTISLESGYDYTGKTLHVKYQGAVATFTGVSGGDTVTWTFAADETAPMALGAFPVVAWLTDANGTRIALNSGNVKIRVTDDPAEVYTGGTIAISARGVLFGIDDLPERYTDADIVAKIREILTAGGALLCALLCLNLHGAEVFTAQKQVIYNDQQVVTNVTFDGLATTEDLNRVRDTIDLSPATNYANYALGRFAATGTVNRATNADAVNGKTAGDLAEAATNAAESTVSRFAETGAVQRATYIGTPSHYMDATGCVWEVSYEFTPWTFSDGLNRSVLYGGFNEDLGWPVYGEDVRGADSSDVHWFSTQDEATNAVRFVYIKGDGTEVTATRTTCEVTNLVARVATLLNVSEAITNAGFMERDDCVDIVNETKALFPASNTNLVYKLRVEWTGEGGAFYFDAYTNAVEAAEAR